MSAKAVLPDVPPEYLHKPQLQDRGYLYLMPAALLRHMERLTWADGYGGARSSAVLRKAAHLGQDCVKRQSGGVLSDADLARTNREQAAARGSGHDLTTQRKHVRWTKDAGVLLPLPERPGWWYLRHFAHRNRTTADWDEVAARRRAVRRARAAERRRSSQRDLRRTDGEKACPDQGLPSDDRPYYKQPGPPAASAGPPSGSAGGEEKREKPTPKDGGRQPAVPSAPAGGIFSDDRVPMLPPRFYRQTLGEQICEARRMGDLTRLKALWRQRDKALAKQVLSKCLPEGPEHRGGGDPSGASSTPVPAPAASAEEDELAWLMRINPQ